MSEQLRQAIAAVGPAEVQRTRALLLAAGDAAIADRSIRALIYAGLATATTDRRGLAGDAEDSPDPFLIGAVLTVNDQEQGLVSRVGEELDEVWLANGDRLVYALALELLMAHCEGWLICDRARDALEGFSDLGDWEGR